MSLPSGTAILDRVDGWGDLVDRAIATGSHRHVGRIGEWSGFEWQATLKDLDGLSKGADAYYDRPTIGPAYALWYHARRVNPLVRQLERIVRDTYQRGHERVEVVDLGAGTGAVAWAAALVAAAIGELDGEPPRVVVHEVESSPLMTATADSLWETLGEELDAFGFVERIPQPVSWPFATITSDAPTWLLASFLLDHTDKNRAEEMAKALHRVVDRCRAEGVVFTVTSSKRQIANSVIDQLESDHQWEGQTRKAPLRWHGPMRHTAAVRRALYTSVGLGSSPLLDKPPRFDGDTLSVREARRPLGDQRQLFTSDVWMQLTDEQQQAVEADPSQSVLVLGAAGSGKSIVLVERLARLVTRTPVGAPRRVLVTTFNNDMLSQLARWLRERLDHEGIGFHYRNHDGYHVFSDVGSGHDDIELLNWDKAPTRLADIHLDGAADDPTWQHYAEIETQRLLANDSRFARLDSTDRAAQPAFQLDELKRVIYGLGALTRDGYETTPRRGRGRAIGTNQKDLVWAVAQSTRPHRYTARRIKMLERARAGTLPHDYTDVYVDEVQDFTPSDIECLLAMHDGTGAAFYAGDETQALHLGLSYGRPRPVRDTWVQGRIVRLEGSHRLPIPIARCVRTLAEAARAIRRANGQADDDISSPDSRKASVIGVRPILVVGDQNHLATQIRLIADTYSGYLEAEVGDHRITVLESDRTLASAIGTPRIESTTVMKIKGLERGMVVWSARRAPNRAAEALETAYTAMTRTSCLLVLAVDPDDLPDSHLEVIRQLDRGHVLRWDGAAERWWTEVIARSSLPIEPSDDTRTAPPPAETPPMPDRPPVRTPAVLSPPSTARRDWDAGQPCDRHDLEWCTLCKPRNLPGGVYTTSGRSAAFHKTPTCPALVSGQHLVVTSGASAAPIETVALESAIAMDKFPCLICFPATRGKL
jgi:DNA helicase-2/ATP-dependent DNA helicase PcrA